MPWWGWMLLLWPVIAVGVTVVIGSAIHLADSKERSRISGIPAHEQVFVPEDPADRFAADRGARRLPPAR